MDTAVSILIGLFVLCVIVLVHELGHYLMGRALGFKILEFSIGMGPVLLQKEKNDIKYSLRALPIGGSCQFYGEDQAVSGKGFNSHPAWKRILVIAAGPVMNILLSLLLAFFSLLIYGDYAAGVESLSEERTLAYESGIRAGDIIYAIDGKKVETYSQVTERILGADPENAVVTVKRDGKLIDIPVKGMYDEEAGRNLLGINIMPVRQPFGFFEAMSGSVRFNVSIIKEMYRFLGSIFTKGVSSGDVAGPIGTIVVVGQAVKMGFEMVLYIGVLLGINLAIINLLPLPALDGGRLVFLVVEWIRGKAIPPEKEGMVHFAGLMLLFGLILLLTFNDIKNLIGG